MLRGEDKHTAAQLESAQRISPLEAAAAQSLLGKS